VTVPPPTQHTSKVVLPSSENLVRAGRALRAGGLVAFPTETVYGLGANATDDRAVANIFALKQRPAFNPLIVHVCDAAQAAEIVEFNALAQTLAQAFWPGALTLVLPRKVGANLSLLVTAGLDTVAVRVPAHAVAQALLTAAEIPIAAPSANVSGTISPTQAGAVQTSFPEAQDLSMIIDGGPCPVGVESTIVDLCCPLPTLLRPGGVSLEDLEACIGPLDRHTGSAIRAPGQLQSHYAPSLPLRMNVDPAHLRNHESLLGFGPHMPPDCALNLSETGDLNEAAAHLFTMMRALDVPENRGIAVAPLPNTGLGLAINDRLARASAEKS